MKTSHKQRSAAGSAAVLPIDLPVFHVFKTLRTWHPFRVGLDRVADNELLHEIRAPLADSRLYRFRAVLQTKHLNHLVCCQGELSV